MKVVEQTPRVALADLRLAAKGCVALVGGKAIDVKITWDRTAYGRRPWLACPSCRARRRHLYLDGPGLACRRCAGLKYLAQTWPDSRWRLQVGRPALAAWRWSRGRAVRSSSSVS